MSEPDELPDPWTHEPHEFLVYRDGDKIENVDTRATPGFKGNKSILLNRAQAPNTESQKDAAIQANRTAKSVRILTSRMVKPSNCSTPAIWVLAATVEANTRNR